MATVLDIANRKVTSPVQQPAIEKTAQVPMAPGAQPTQPSLVGLTREELAERLQAIGVSARESRMRVAQLWHWIYFRGIDDFSQMTNVGKALRENLAAHYTLSRPEVISEQVSQDGTRKWLMRMPSTGPFDKGAEIECVYIPETDRGTLCVSSQVGCTLTCTFCHTGTQKLVAQSHLRRDRRPACRRPGSSRRLAGSRTAGGRLRAEGGRALRHQCRLYGDGRAAL